VSQPPALSDYINSRVVESVDEYARTFKAARPFPYVVINDFLSSDFCSRIGEQFPAFRKQDAITENRRVGGKATREEVRSLGSAFVEADDLVQNREFLSMVERISGVERLQYDPFYYGGGTHENRQGQDLDPHIDFNYHPISSQHRRLNLIVYLNEEWDDAWGGCLQLHRDPYIEPARDEIITVTPLRNRCVIFETSERSWHGFDRIDLPEGKRHLTRKSFAVYFYTDTRLNRLRFSGGDGKRGSLNLEDVPEDLRSAVRMIQVLRYRVDELESSTSWRVTAPLRSAKRLFSGKS